MAILNRTPELPRRIGVPVATAVAGLLAGTSAYFLAGPPRGHGGWPSPAAAAVRPASAPSVSPAREPDPLEREAIERSRRLRLFQREVRYPVFSGGLRTEKLVSLTFDDGPDPKTTPAILDILKREHVPATFFVIGSKAERYPELIRREALEGHDLGNHTYHHFELTQLNTDAIRFEIERTNGVLEHILGGPTRWFRAPGCHYTAEALEAIEQTRMVRVDTTDNSGDWDKYGISSIMNRALTHLSNGDVLLFHDRMPKTVELLPSFIQQVKRRGYRFVPLTQLALRAQKNPDFKPAYWPDREGIRIEVTGAHPDPDPYLPAPRRKSPPAHLVNAHRPEPSASHLTPAVKQAEPTAIRREPAAPERIPTDVPEVTPPAEEK